MTVRLLLDDDHELLLKGRISAGMSGWDDALLLEDCIGRRALALLLPSYQ